jgi:hypothetical protein
MTTAERDMELVGEAITHYCTFLKCLSIKTADFPPFNVKP